MKGIIYKYTGPTGKIYIGQTTRSIKERAKDTKGNGYNKCPYFWNAIQKYGFENFTVEELEVFEECTIEFLNEREIYWISYYNSTDPAIGYNCDSGGGTVPDVSKRVCQYDENKKLVKIYDSLTEAAHEVQCAISTLSQACHGKKQTCKGYFWSFEGQLPSFKHKPARKKVYEFDEDCVLIKEFESASNADRYYHFPIGTVSQCANKNNNLKRAHGRLFTYEPFVDEKYYKPLKPNDYPKGEQS